jgi:DNA-binding NarL/FixJ family response regulator
LGRHRSGKAFVMNQHPTPSASPSGAAAGGPVKVLLVDDHRTFTDLVVHALQSEPDLACVGAAHDSETARAMVAALAPDIVLMDVNLGLEDGLELTAQLRSEAPALRVVVLTAHGEAAVTRRAVVAGACAVLPKNGSLPELLQSLRSASAAGVMVHPSLLHRLVDDDREAVAPEPEAPVSLTPRELHVLQLLAHGRDVRSISRELGISVNTCRGYVQNILTKLGVHSQLEAVVVAGMRRLVDTPRP